MKTTAQKQTPALTPAGQAGTPRLCLIGSPYSGLAVHAILPDNLGHSDPLARIVIKDPASAQEFGSRVLTACNSHARLLAENAALVAALETVERAFALDNEHPWIPGAIAPAIRIEVRAALASSRTNR